MAAVAVVAVAVVLVVVVARLTGGHGAHSGSAAVPTSPGQVRGDGSSLLRVGIAGLLFGGWALAFTVGIWRRWRITDHGRSDYDNVSEPG